jgi:hypothetical protein
MENDHYKQTNTEPIKVIEAWCTQEEFKGFLYGNVIKYIGRYKHKGTPKPDLEKAKWYLDCLINQL